jgi:hypothetical protein
MLSTPLKGFKAYYGSPTRMVNSSGQVDSMVCHMERMHFVSCAER